MPYDNAIPQSTDRLPISQPDLLQNFIAIQTFIEVNHETFGAATEGKHKITTFPQQTVSGVFPPVTSATEVALYCKTDGANPSLYFRPYSQTVGVTTNDVDIMHAVKAASGETTLPSGIKMKWGIGSVTSGSSTSAAVTFYSAFSTAVYSVQITPYGSRATGAAQDYVLSAYDIQLANLKVTRTGAYTGATAAFYYLAIGI